GKLKMLLDYTSVDHRSPSAIGLTGDDPKKQFAEQLLQRYAKLNARPDPINRCTGAQCYRDGLPRELQDVEQTLARLASRPAGGLRVIDQLPEATMLRVELSDGSREIYSLLRNRAHSNVAFMLGEELRYQPRLDTLTIYPEVLSSYPNFLFTVKAGEVDAFVKQMEAVSDAKSFEQIVERWGVRRSHPEFWRYFHDLAEHIRETQPLETGVLDMNRYQNL
ncbi:MAG: fatty acid cis/trans isomerase, partial [Pseudomonas sp.]